MRVDARNQICPKPVVMALGALPKLQKGESLEVIVNNEAAVHNLARLAQEKDCDLKTEANGDETILTLTPRGVITSDRSAQDEAADFCEIPDVNSSVIAIGKDHMGEGNDELGKILIEGLIYAFAHQAKVPKKMIFFNGGAYLTCKGSESLEDLKELEKRGTTILTCGTCLDYYKMRDQLAIGGVTNLYEIAQTFSSNPGVTLI